MYFKLVSRRNPATGQLDCYYRIVESYRNIHDRVCHRTLLNIGFIEYDKDLLPKIQIILNDKQKNAPNLFKEENTEALAIAMSYWNQMVEKGKVDADVNAKKLDRQVNIDTIKHKNVREVGAEWLCYQAVEQLGIGEKLVGLGWSEEQVQLALTQIVCRAVYPFSELRTSKIIKENSAICEITGYPIEKITKDKLYQSAKDLFKVKDSLEQYLSKKTNELFDLKDKIILYDLTNTYFEGRMLDSKLAQHAKRKSKEKRDDAKIVVLALVVNTEGFIKFSSVFEGKMSDDKSLPAIIDKLRIYTSEQSKAIVVLDAGIATEDNLKLILSKGYDYVCVSRSKIKDYTIDPDNKTVYFKNKANQQVSLQKVNTTKATDYILKVYSSGKQDKEVSMNKQFEERFTKQIQTIEMALSKKGGTKKIDKVQRRIGRAIEKYPSVAKHYDIEVTQEEGIAKTITLLEKPSYKIAQEELGKYFIRTSLNAENEKIVWDIYNSIREIESSFRCLKTDLDLRPIYHKTDQGTMAHLYLGILAYWIVNTIRHQLKGKGIKDDWQEVKRKANTQKIITTTGTNASEQVISVRKCSQPNKALEELQNALNYKKYPFTKHKSVVHKPKLKNLNHQQNRHPT
jgi:hypothetical protein